MLFSFKKIWSLTSLLTILCHQIQGVPIWGHHVSYRVSQKEVIYVRGVSGQGRQCGDTNYDPYHISHTLLVTGLSPVKRNISENISAPLSCDSSQCLVRPHHTGHQDTEQSMQGSYIQDGKSIGTAIFDQSKPLYLTNQNSLYFCVNQ